MNNKQKNYIPNQGDIIVIDFNPVKGHEEAGRRPAVIVSNEAYHKYTRMALVVPVSTTNRKFPMNIPLDDRTSIEGQILCSQLKAVDLNARNVKFIEKIPEEILHEVKDIVFGSIE